MKQGGGDDPQRGKEKASADGAQGGHADGKQLCAGVEDPQKLLRQKQEGKHARRHNAEGDHAALFQCGQEPLFILCAVIVAHNGKQALRQAEDGHKDKGLQLEIKAEDRVGRRGKA